MFATVLFLVIFALYCHLWAEYESRHAAPPQVEPTHEEPVAEPVRIAAQAAAIAAPVATAIIRTEPAEGPQSTDYSTLTLKELRKACIEHNRQFPKGDSRRIKRAGHLNTAQAIAALQLQAATRP